MRTRSLLAALILVAVPVVSSAEQSDANLARVVSDALRRCPHYTIFDDVSVAVADRTVTLSGEVTSPAKRSAIAADVGRIGGVRQVVNEIDVLPASASDIDLRQRAAQAIYGHAAFWEYASMSSPPIHIIVRHGHVRLAGTVATDVERALAQTAAAVSGAASVKNDLVVANRRGDVPRS